MDNNIYFEKLSISYSVTEPITPNVKGLLQAIQRSLKANKEVLDYLAGRAIYTVTFKLS